MYSSKIQLDSGKNTRQTQAIYFPKKIPGRREVESAAGCIVRANIKDYDDSTLLGHYCNHNHYDYDHEACEEEKRMAVKIRREVENIKRNESESVYIRTSFVQLYFFVFGGGTFTFPDDCKKQSG